jgi:hypothetical protein
MAMKLFKLYIEDLNNNSDSKFTDDHQNDGTTGTRPSEPSSTPLVAEDGRCTKAVPERTNNYDPSQHTEEEQELIQSAVNWVNKCFPSDEWQMPYEWLAESDELRQVADERVRQRNAHLRIWRTGKNRLVCKAWLGPEPPPNKTYNGKSRLRRYKSNRIETMWSEAQGWCRWDTLKQDYVPDTNNREKLESTEVPTPSNS